jgi:hypothetical protein
MKDFSIEIPDIDMNEPAAEKSKSRKQFFAEKRPLKKNQKYHSVPVSNGRIITLTEWRTSEIK